MMPVKSPTVISMNYGKRGQQGVVLLIIVIILALASMTYVVTNLSADEIRLNSQSQNIEVLKKAKRALLAHALTNSYRVTDVGRIGNLPCPDKSNISPEGEQDPNCGNLDTNTIGYFPWKRMGIDVLKDLSGTCLLYAVSPSYKLNNERMLNEDSNGLFQVVDAVTGIPIVGNLPEERPVAIIFSANMPVGAQVRNPDNTTICGKDFANLVSAYLDDNGVINNGVLTGVPNTIDQFVHATSTSANSANPLNDTFITINKSEIWSAIREKTDVEDKLTEVAEALAVCLRDYAKANANRQLPWPASLDLSLSVGTYFADDNYDDVANASQGYAGRYPYIVDNSNSKTGVSGADIFSAAACNNIDLPSTTILTEAIDLSTTGEYGIIWHNWKDHFYYALSKKYEPDGAATSDSICGATGGCVSVNGAANKYAAIVFYSGKNINGVARTSPEVTGGPDQKAVIANYLENNNESDFNDMAGEGDYESGVAGNNDIMFCITNEPDGVDLNVTAC